MYTQRHNEAGSRNHCCRGKAIRIAQSYSVCSFIYPACKAHAPHYIFTFCLLGSTIFFHIIS